MTEADDGCVEVTLRLTPEQQKWYRHQPIINGVRSMTITAWNQTIDMIADALAVQHPPAHVWQVGDCYKLTQLDGSVMVFQITDIAGGRYSTRCRDGGVSFASSHSLGELAEEPDALPCGPEAWMLEHPIGQTTGEPNG